MCCFYVTLRTRLTFPKRIKVQPLLLDVLRQACAAIELSPGFSGTLALLWLLLIALRVLIKGNFHNQSPWLPVTELQFSFSKV